MTEDKLQNIITFLTELKDDSSVPKNVKTSMGQIITILQGNLDISLKIDKVMHFFEELHDDSNIDSFTRSQLWNVVSMLESLKN